MAKTAVITGGSFGTIGLSWLRTTPPSAMTLRFKLTIDVPYITIFPESEIKVKAYSNKLFASFVPLGVVTNTLAEPRTLAPVIAVMVVESTTVNSATATPPIVTSVAPVKSVPAIVTEVPPNVDPLEGETLDTVGANETYSKKLFELFKFKQ